MVKTISPRGRGRPDYSQNVEKVALPTPKKRQTSYWFTTTIILGAGSYGAYTIEKGFDKEHSYVPEGKVFIPERIEITADANVLISLGLAIEDVNGHMTMLNRAYGYQRVVIESRRAYKFPENTRPVYYIMNHGDVMVALFLNAVGTVEDKEEV